MLKFLKSKTVWGGVLMGLPQLLDVLASGMLGVKAAGIAQGLGTILFAVGVKGAVSKGKIN